MITKSKIKKDISSNNEEHISTSKRDKVISELYFHNMFLFSLLVNSKHLKHKSWKIKDQSIVQKPNFFLVGIQTQQGSYAHHYHKKYWDYFKVKEVEDMPNITTKIEDIVLLLNQL